MPLAPEVPSRFAGREFDQDELDLLREVVETCSGLSRTELAKTVCELLRWRRANGSLKALECREYLERLESSGWIQLPPLRRRRPLGSTTRIPKTARGEPRQALVGSVQEFSPIVVEEVRHSQQSELFRELVGRYHYLGYQGGLRGTAALPGLGESAAAPSGGLCALFQLRLANVGAGSVDRLGRFHAGS